MSSGTGGRTSPCASTRCRTAPPWPAAGAGVERGGDQFERVEFHSPARFCGSQRQRVNALVEPQPSHLDTIPVGLDGTLQFLAAGLQFQHGALALGQGRHEELAGGRHVHLPGERILGAGPVPHLKTLGAMADALRLRPSGYHRLVSHEKRRAVALNADRPGRSGRVFSLLSTHDAGRGGGPLSPPRRRPRPAEHDTGNGQTRWLRMRGDLVVQFMSL